MKQYELTNSLTGETVVVNIPDQETLEYCVDMMQRMFQCEIIVTELVVQ
jgi:hypothetical protein